MKKALIGVAAAAAVVFVYFAIAGWPTSDSSQGAIGAAKRYNAGQLASGDVQVGDAQVQQVLQSDAFARLIKDKNALKVLMNSEMRAELVNFSNLLQNDVQLQQTLAEPGVALALGKDLSGSLATLNYRGFNLADNQAVAVALQRPDVQQALARPDLRVALQHGGAELTSALNRPEFQALQAHPALVTAMAQPQIAQGLLDLNVLFMRNQALSGLATNQAFIQALSNLAFGAMLGDLAVGGALQQPGVVSFLSGAAFAPAVSSPEFANQLNVALEQAGLTQELQGQEMRGGVRGGDLQGQDR